MTEIAIFPIFHLFVYSYLIKRENKFWLVDALLPKQEKKILAKIDGLGGTLTDLEGIIITHADGDHIGSINPLVKLTGARVYASKIEGEAITAGKHSREIHPKGIQKVIYAAITPFIQPIPAHVDETLAAGKYIPAFPELEVMSTPGHTPGHVSFFIPSYGALFCGDSMIKTKAGIISNTSANSWSNELANVSFKSQMSLEAETIYGGHFISKVNNQ